MSNGKRNLVIGVDPGIHGAVAIYDANLKQVETVFDMPIVEVKDRKQIEIYELASAIEAYSFQVDFAVVEEVHAMTYVKKHEDGTLEKRGQGAAASFNFGKAAGIVHGVLAAFQIPIFFVKPGVWKMVMGLSANKDASRARASQLFANEVHRWSRKKDDGRAEALLLAWFGAQRFRRNGE